MSGTTSTSIAPGGSYTTKKGDTLASISRRAYGKTERWQDIWLANYDALGDDVDKPAAGIRLKIPR
jgi:nucleoid-associated protein YgaU